LVGAGWSGVCVAQEAVTSSDEINALIADHAWAFGIDGEGGLFGEGADRLVGEAAGVSFLAIGEQHLSNETPALCGGLVRALAPRGYGALVIESGELVTGYVEGMIREGRAAEAPGFFAGRPYTMAFFDHAPEFALIEEAVGLGYELWGIDQVFMGGARFALGELVEVAPSDGAREAAEAALARAEAGFGEVIASGNPGAVFLFSATDGDFDALEAAFAGSEAGLRIIGELRASSEIYKLYQSGANYESNLARIELMKRHLAARLRAAPGTRAILKFGTFHCARGYSTMNQLDVGNFVGEVGVLRGDGSLQLMVVPADLGLEGGTNPPARVSPPDSSALGRAYVAIDRPEEQEWVLFDVRPLRAVFHSMGDDVDGTLAGLERIAWSFDVVAMCPTLTDAEPLPGVPPLPGR